MPHHNWGDEDFDWEALNNSIQYCMDFWRRWGRIGTHGKEKFGSFRDHVYLWDGGIWTLVFPGYVWIRPGVWHFVHFYLDWYIVKPFTQKTGLLRLGWWYQAQVYNYAIEKMCKKYPHIIDELVANLDGYQMVKPGIFGNVDGEAIHNKYWTSI